MATDNENGNSSVNTGPKVRISTSAQLIADTLLEEFTLLGREMDEREQLMKKKMERREKLLMWVLSILPIFSAFALPVIAAFMYDLKEAMEHMDKTRIK